MITTMRSQFKQTTYRYVILFMVFMLIVSMIASLFIKTEHDGGNRWALKVNGTEISLYDFNREVAKQTEFLNYWRTQYGQLTEMLFHAMGMQTDPKIRAIDHLTKQELLTQYAQQLGITVDADYMNRCINNTQFVKQHLGHIIPLFVFDASGRLNMAHLSSYLKQNGISAEQFEHSVEQALIQLQILEHAAATLYHPLFEAKQQFIVSMLSKNFSYLYFSLDKFLKQEKSKKISQEELEDYYNSQNTRYRTYWVPEKRNGFVWQFKPENYAITITQEEIEEYYNDNKVKSYVLEPLKIEVKEIVLGKDAQLSLEEIRQDLMQNETSEWNKRWVAVKPFARGDKKNEYEKVAFLLQNEGDISHVFANDQGESVLLKLVKRIPRTYKPLSSVQSEIRAFLTNKAFKKRFVQDMKAIMHDEKSIEALIAEKAEKREVVANSMKDDNTRLAQELWGLKKGHYSFYVENGIGRAVYLSDISDRYLPDLESIKDIVTNDIHESRARTAMKNAVEYAQNAASNQNFDVLAQQTLSTLGTTGFVQLSDQKNIKELERKGLPLRVMLSLEKVGSLIDHIGENEGYLVKLDDIQSFDQEQFEANLNAIKNQLSAPRTQLFLDSIVASLHRNATIETNELLLITDKDYSE